MAEAQPKKRVIRLTPTLIEDIVALVVAHPEARKTLQDFFRLRTQPGPVVPFGGKDSPLKGKYLGGVWHAHLVYGQALLIYRVFKESVHCYCIVDHTFVESSPKQKSLSKVIETLEANGLLPFDPAAHIPVQNDIPAQVAVPAIPAAIAAPLARHELDDIFYEFVAHLQDRVVVEKAAVGDFEDLKTYLGYVFERDMGCSAEWDLVTDAFGGVAAFQARLGAILAELAPLGS